MGKMKKRILKPFIAKTGELVAQTLVVTHTFNRDKLIQIRVALR